MGLHIFATFRRPYCLILIITITFWLFYSIYKISTTDFGNRKHILVQQFPNYYEDNLHPTWKFKISRNYDGNLLNSWREPVRNLTMSNALGQGENGTAFVVSKQDIKVMAKLQMEHNYNVFASERISIRRMLPDFRSPECRNVKYPGRLPTTTVIIVFHNEIWSTLLRTVWSIIDRSPRELLEEIILVDDASTWTSLKNPLTDYVTTLPFHVRIIRSENREGLIRARLLGANEAKGSILTFFDAHVEVTDGWLPPIISRIADDRSTVVVPSPDSIDSNDMSFKFNEFMINGLRWFLIFNWLPVPERESIRTKYDKTAPIRTPTHVGYGFSIDREFFFEIGSYDEGMDIWGSENVEMALRVWMCGGSLEMMPCSHVGHLYRISTYSFNGDKKEIKQRNDNRLVEVWLDEFKEFFYAANPDSKNVSPGNITNRLELRKRLQCKSFRWYLESIYPESTWLKEYNMMGEMQNVDTETCLDIFSTAQYDNLMVIQCYGAGGNQFFAFAKTGQIVTVEDICVGVDGTNVILVPCLDEDETQLWNWDSKEQWIVHRQSNLCMQNNGSDVVIGACNANDNRCKWNFKSNLRMH